MISAGPLRRYLEENEVEINTVATAMGVTRATLSRFVNDKHISSDCLNKICKTLNLQPYQVIKYYKEGEING